MSALRTLLVGDVHACAAELAELLELAVPDRLIMLGDLFTKGPDPAGVWRLLQDHDAQSVLGNHDLAVLARPDRVELPAAAVDWLGSRPLFIEGHGPRGPWLAVHAGLHPRLGRDGTDRQRATVMRRWPDDNVDSNPFWWELWSGPPMVVYGHDAMRGLVDRRPHSLGLDTGCVYGGALSGYLVEEDRLLRVPARRAYKDVRRKPRKDPTT